MVTTGYDRLAVTWDAWAETVVPDVRLNRLEPLLVALPTGAKVVELGCGTGHPVAAALAQDYDYLGVDISPGMIEVAREQVPGAKFRIADMVELDLPAGSVGGVVACYSIIHVPRRSHASLFGPIRRWLGEGGMFIASFVTSDLETGVDEDWLGSGPMFWSGFDPRETLTMLETAGFAIVDSRVVGQMEGADEVEFLWVTCRAH